MPDKVKVRVSMFPDPIDVPEDEVEVLRAQGLLRDEPEPAAAPRPAAKSSAQKSGEPS